MNDSRIFFRPSSVKLLSLLAFLFIGLALTSVIQAIVTAAGIEVRSALLLISVAQSVVAFMLPAWAAAWLFDKDWRSYLSIDTHLSGRALLGVALLFLLALPFINQTVFWNENVTFPDNLETAFRAMEDRALEVTNTMLGDTSVWGLFSGILVVGLITGLAEELFFRGALQKIFLGMIRPAAAIVLTALVFSLLHMQFYGFAPRVLMGILFGYLCWRSGSVFVSASAHILNNSIVVLTTWLSARGAFPADIDTLGVNESGFPWIALLSCVATVAVIILAGDYFFGGKSEEKKKEKGK